jgi:hypothetical protein
MIGTLIFEAPHVWKLIRDQLIGNGGQPDENGDAVGGFVRQTEIKNNAPKGTYWYRFIRPNDTVVGSTQYQYDVTCTTSTPEHLFAIASVVQVPTGEATAYFGWYSDIDLGQNGYFRVLKEGVEKSLIIGRIVWRQQHPRYYFFDLDHVIFAEENATVDYQAYNAFGSDRTGHVFPLLFRIASRAKLNLEKAVY